MMIGTGIFQFAHKMKELWPFQMRGIIQKYGQIFSLQEQLFFLKFWRLDPSIKMAITPTFFEQIEKFQCLSSSTAEGLSRDTWHTHVARVQVPENVS